MNTCMLAHDYNDFRDKITGTFTITEKIDGIRCLAFKDDTSIAFKSRSNKPLEGLIDIIEDLKSLPSGYVYDGELVHLNGDFSSTSSKVRTIGEVQGVHFLIFDIIPISEYDKGKSLDNYFNRRLALNSLIPITLSLPWIIILPVLYIGNDISEIDKHLKNLTDSGSEGIMINLSDSHYELKRSRGILKYKKFSTVDLKIIGIEKGMGKNKERLGNLWVDYHGNEVKVGSGFTDEERQQIWDQRIHYLNKIVEVKYFEETTTKDKKGRVNHSLRFPTFLRFRFDK